MWLSSQHVLPLRTPIDISVRSVALANHTGFIFNLKKIKYKKFIKNTAHRDATTYEQKQIQDLTHTYKTKD